MDAEYVNEVLSELIKLLLKRLVHIKYDICIIIIIMSIIIS